MEVRGGVPSTRAWEGRRWCIFGPREGREVTGAERTIKVEGPEGQRHGDVMSVEKAKAV